MDLDQKYGLNRERNKALDMDFDGGLTVVFGHTRCA